MGNYMNIKEGKSSWVIGELLFFLYRIDKKSIRSILRWLVLKLENGMYYSITIRRIFRKYYGVDVGMYSGCGGFSPRIFKAGTTIGRYTTVTSTVRAFNANHTINTKSSHALFFEPGLGMAKKNPITRKKLTVGNDVFIGHNAIILPSVTLIDNGVYIGSGAVVTKNPPPYSIVVGNPAKVIGYRYDEQHINEIVNSKWWEKSLHELEKELDSFHVPLDGSGIIR